MGPHRSRVVLLSLVLATSTAAGCGDDDAPTNAGPPPAAEESIDFELFASTRSLGDGDLALLATNDETGRLVFDRTPPALDGIDVGQVILAPLSAKTPAGLLRVVTKVERDGDKLALQTAAAPLQVAFKRLHARAIRDARPADPGVDLVVTDTSPLAWSPGAGIKPLFTVAKGSGGDSRTYEVVLFDGDGDTSTKNDQIALEATFGGRYAYDLAIDVDWGGIAELPEVVKSCLASVAKVVVGEKPSCSIDDLLPEAKTTFTVKPSVTLDVDVHGAASLAFEKSFEIGTMQLPPFALGPLVFTPSVDVLAKLEGGASARFDVGASARADLESSVTLSSKSFGAPQYVPPKLVNKEVKAHDPSIDLHAGAKAQVGTRLNVPLYGTAGPYATASGVAQIDASPLDTPCWKLQFALEGEIGVRITTPRLPLIGYVTLADFRPAPFRPFDELVAEGSCTVLPDPPLPPGGGPTATVFQTPTFTPWAKQLSGSVDGSYSETGTFGLGAPDLTAAIDGRYILGGPVTFGLHKIDPDGNLVWTSSLYAAETKLRTLRTAPARDGSLLALVEPPDTAAFDLAGLGQSGALAWVSSYRLPDTCIATRSHLLATPSGGFVVLGECNSGEGWVARVDERGDAVRARMLHGEPESRMELRTATVSDGDVVIAGSYARQGELEWPLVVRLDAEDRPTSGTVFRCAERITGKVAAIAPAENGGVTVVGEANGPAFVARVRRDGALGFATFPHRGIGVTQSLLLSAVAELPTTGLVVAGSYVAVGSGTPASVVLAGLDSGGRALWAGDYAAAGTPRPLAVSSLRLTDDGGIFATAVAGPAGAPGELYAMKVFAKDGSLDDGAVITKTTALLEDLDCAAESRSFVPTATDTVVTRETPFVPITRK